MKSLLLPGIFWFIILSPIMASGASPDEPLVVPASTAYSEPDPGALEIAPETGLTGWTDSKDQAAWYGVLKSTGPLELSLTLRLPETTLSRLRLTITRIGPGLVDHPLTARRPLPQEKPARAMSLTAQANGPNPQPVTVGLGHTEIEAPGAYRFGLEGLEKQGRTFGDLNGLLLSGPAAKEAHFSMAATRGAPSVHLWYPASKDVQVAWFYNEVTVRTDPLWSYYMACGFSRGYFGIQVNSPTERRIIFSVWNSGNEPKDPTKVPLEDRVELLAKGENVFAGAFGNEGTGGHSHLIYPWKTGHTYRLLVTARPRGSSTIYTGYFYFPEKKKWGLIASFRAPKDGGYLRGLYSFNEDFNGANGQQERLAEFGPQWIKTAAGQWMELRTAHFTHTSDGAKERLDRGAGVSHRHFYLTNGGFIPMPGHYGDSFTRPSSSPNLRDILLPPQ